jgi:hypothetical protein
VQHTPRHTLRHTTLSSTPCRSRAAISYSVQSEQHRRCSLVEHSFGFVDELDCGQYTIRHEYF